MEEKNLAASAIAGLVILAAFLYAVGLHPVLAVAASTGVVGLSLMARR